MGFGGPVRNRKVSPEDVIEIRALVAGGQTQRQVAEQFDISREYVGFLYRSRLVAPAQRVELPITEEAS
jgi:hypothetical protein